MNLSLPWAPNRCHFEALQRDRHHEAHHAAAGRWHEKTDRQAGRLKQTGKQTDKQGRGNAPESNDTSHCLPAATQTQTEQAGWRAGRRGAAGFRKKTEEPSVDTQQPAHLKHTACNDWRHGCLPWGTKQEGGGCKAPTHSTTSSSTNPNGWGSINNGSGNNNPNKPWQRVGYLSELLIDHSRLETSPLLASIVRHAPLSYMPQLQLCIVAILSAGVLYCGDSYFELGRFSCKHIPQTFIHRECALYLVWCRGGGAGSFLHF